MRDRDSWLNATMIELADRGHAVLDDAAYIDNFAARLAELLGPAEVSLLLLGATGTTGATGPTEPAGGELAAGSGDLGAGLARLETDGRTGPCATCYRTGQTVRRLPLATARDRWPEFTTAAIAAGLATCWALPMRRHTETIGAVAVLAASDHEIGAADFRLAETLTEMATISILRQR